MLDVVHIKFEKLTGLHGTVEGMFTGDMDKIKPELPLIFEAVLISHSTFVFRQDGQYIYLKPADFREVTNYLEHFRHGVNFLIKEWSYGRGEGIKHTGSPN
jgi:hypothetical protein